MSQRLSEKRHPYLFTLMQPMVRWLASFSTGWSPTATTISFTESNPQPGDDDVIMSDADFQTVRTNATAAGRVFYVWGSGSALTYYREFIRSEIESASVRGRAHNDDQSK